MKRFAVLCLLSLLVACGGGGGTTGGSTSGSVTTPTTDNTPVTPSTSATVPKLQLSGTIAESADSLGDIKLIGEILNTGDASATFGQITFNFYDSTSKLIGTDYTYIVGTVLKLTSTGSCTNTALKPGEKGVFMALTTVPRANVARYDYSITWSTYDIAAPAANLVVTGSVNAQSDRWGDLELLGQAKNTGTKGLTFGEVYFIIKNSSGVILDVHSQYITGETVTLSSIGMTTDTALSVNATGTFDASTTVPFASYASYDIKYDWTDADIIAGVAKFMLLPQSATDNAAVPDQKTRWSARNQEIQRQQQLINESLNTASVL